MTRVMTAYADDDNGDYDYDDDDDDDNDDDDGVGDDKGDDYAMNSIPLHTT